MMNSMRLRLWTLLAFLAGALAFAQNSVPSGDRPRIAAGLVTEEQIPALESDLVLNPDNLDARAKLLSDYRQRRKGPDFMRHLLWLSDHHPESQILDSALETGFTKDDGWLNTAAEYQKGRAIWEQKLIETGNSPVVLFHAGLFFEYTDPERAAQLFHRARELEPSSGKYLSAEATIYWVAFANHAFPDAPADGSYTEAAGRLEHNLLTSTDASLVSQVGTELVQGSMANASETQNARGYDLLQRAIDIDPENPKWKDAFEAVKAEREAMAKAAREADASSVHATVLTGPQASEANLLKKVEPVYPELATQARIQGTVEFKMTIGPDGHVQNIELLRGHPLLVDAAKQAVEQWVYRPTLLNGNPVTVTTTVTILFQLTQ